MIEPRWQRNPKKWRTALVLVLGFLAASPALSNPVITRADSVLVLVPHPDDEVLGCGGVIQLAKAAGARVRVVFLTVGDANEWSFIFWEKRPVLVPREVLALGRRRHREALAAAHVLGLEPSAITFLGYPDHETEKMLLEHWGNDRPAVRGRFTRAARVPYKFAFRPDAPHRGNSVMADLKTILKEFKPTRLFVSHPADHHPDHHALYLYATIALWDLAPAIQPTVHPFLVHFPRWPAAHSFAPEQPLEPPESLASGSWTRLPLQDTVVTTKRDALEKHATQYSYSAQRLLPFVTSNELFGDLPAIVLHPGLPPHEIRDDEASFQDATAVDLHESRDAREDAAFVDLETVHLHVDERRLIVTTHVDRPLPEGSFLTFHYLGWRRDRRFADMPKLTVRVGADTISVTENGKPLRNSGILHKRALKRIDILIPLQLLRKSERALFGAAGSGPDRVFDQVPWRTLEFPSR